MRAKLKRLHSPDVNLNDSSLTMNDGSFSYLVQAMIGPSESSAEESFDFIVCSPCWISEKADSGMPFFAKNHLVVNRFDITLIFNSISSLCGNFEEDSWVDLASKIGRYGKWEYEDYRESR